MEVGKKRACRATTERGPCRAPAKRGRDFCRFHDPEDAERRRAASSKGGKVSQLMRGRTVVKGLPDDLMTVAALKRVLAATVMRLWHDECEPDKARAIGQLVKIQCQLIVDADLETRVAELETRLAIEGSD